MKNFKANPETIIKEMLQTAGANKIEDLFSQINEKARIKSLNLPEALSEMETQKIVKRLAKTNKTDYAYFIGAGAYKRFIPAAVSQIASRFEFNTAYTPYQPEISQGTLQVIYEFQSMICDITGMDVCNASVYDAATACAEAMLMASRISGRKKILISAALNNQYKEVVNTYAHAGNIIIEEVSQKDFKTDIEVIKEKMVSGEYAGLIIQNPNFYGTIEDIDIIKNIKKDPKTLLIVCIEPISASVLKSPVSYGADITIGDVQSFGNAVSFGGPYAGFIAVLDKYKRQMPGRIVGKTIDADGKDAYTLTLQAREQHIRREKATGNICSNQGLAVLNSVVYLSLLGLNGIQQAAYLSASNARKLAIGLKTKGINVLNKSFFNEFVIEVESADKFLEEMKQKGILAGIKINNKNILVCTTEINTGDEINKYIDCI
ncbi:MAG: aminomethyl-transferring glycine dehydrogenase subunit GcvPA [Candidatus Gastranaerophilales bacterium]|nr:aminomethyl-transferring glycine dehydrogenase subunit GcvPA [Candidatus Gastranaerophilales bacterium]